MCRNDWTDLYTDRNSPESFVPGKGYRGLRRVGMRCRCCARTVLFDRPYSCREWPGLYGLEKGPGRPVAGLEEDGTG